MGYRATRPADPLGCEYVGEEHFKSKAPPTTDLSYLIGLSTSSAALRPVSTTATPSPDGFEPAITGSPVRIYYKKIGAFSRECPCHGIQATITGWIVVCMDFQNLNECQRIKR